jgi:hypothetical protein
MKLAHLALGSLALPLVVASCSAGPSTTSSSSTTGLGGASSGTAAGGAGGLGGSAGTTTTTSTTTGGACGEGAQQCSGGVHQVCTSGVFAPAPCAAGLGCDKATGACLPCACAPGALGKCADATTATLCNADCFGTTPMPCPGGETCQNGACSGMVCAPNVAHCMDASTSVTCSADGTTLGPPTACGPKEQCSEGPGCQSLCAILGNSPSSVGCSFFAINMWNFNEANPDAVVVGNTSSTLTAVVNVYSSPGGVETLLQGNVQIPPLGEFTFFIPNDASDVIQQSQLRKGGSFRVASDLPVVAYLHSPLAPQATNDASCLLPEPTLGTHYFVASYTDALNAYPSYFDVIAAADNTQVTFKPVGATVGGAGVAATAGGQSTVVTMNRYDTLQVAATSGGDVTGTEIIATGPIAVIGAVQCAQVPAGATYCDHVEEQAVPIRNWGQTYIGAHAPTRSGSEHYFWRVLASADGTTISTTPTQAGFPKKLNKGQFYEFSTTQSFVFNGDHPFAAFQYLSGQNAFGAGTGDPAMMNAVPVEQFLSRYVILTPSGYTNDYVQLLRISAADVQVDGVTVPANAYSTVGAYTVADYAVSAGTHVITSSSPFGIMGIGYTAVTSYGYPGGLALNNIAPN